MHPSDTCTSLAREVEEPLPGTAPTALGWLAVEVPGSWGRDGITASRLAPDLAQHLVDAAAGHPVRVQAIRRPGHQTPTRPSGRTVVLAHSGATPWCEVLQMTDADLATLDPTVCASPTPPGIGRPDPGPVLLVCTHGRRDRCCATLGRPVADTLAALHPGRVWEASHVGGHRFAANLVVLPDGLVYGGLDVAGAVETVAHHLAGRVDITHLRGRSGLDRPAQAIEALTRRHLDEARADVLRVDHYHDTGGGVVATVHTPTGRLEVRLERDPVGRPRRLSCDAEEPEDPPAYVLRSATRVAS